MPGDLAYGYAVAGGRESAQLIQVGAHLAKHLDPERRRVEAVPITGAAVVDLIEVLRGKACVGRPVGPEDHDEFLRHWDEGRKKYGRPRGCQIFELTRPDLYDPRGCQIQTCQFKMGTLD